MRTVGWFHGRRVLCRANEPAEVREAFLDGLADEEAGSDDVFGHAYRVGREVVFRDTDGNVHPVRANSDEDAVAIMESIRTKTAHIEELRERHPEEFKD